MGADEQLHVQVCAGCVVAFIAPKSVSVLTFFASCCDLVRAFFGARQVIGFALAPCGTQCRDAGHRATDAHADQRQNRAHPEVYSKPSTLEIVAVM
jgi:hypothetical protein